MDTLDLDCDRDGPEPKFDCAGLFGGHSMNIRPMNFKTKESDNVAHCLWQDDNVTEEDTLRFGYVILNMIIYSILFLLVLLVGWKGWFRGIARAGEVVDELSFWCKWPGRMLFQQSSGIPIGKSPYLALVLHHLSFMALYLTLVALPVLRCLYDYGGLNIHRWHSDFDLLALTNLGGPAPNSTLCPSF